MHDTQSRVGRPFFLNVKKKGLASETTRYANYIIATKLLYKLRTFYIKHILNLTTQTEFHSPQALPHWREHRPTCFAQSKISRETHLVSGVLSRLSISKCAFQIRMQRVLLSVLQYINVVIDERLFFVYYCNLNDEPCEKTSHRYILG